MGIEHKDTYFIAVKVFLEKNGKLLILKDCFGKWDLPGGRLQKDEFDTPLEDVIKRKMKEELGDNVQYTIGQPLLFMRHQRVEQVEGSPTIRIFAIGYEGLLQSGDIHLSERHSEMIWVDPKNFKPEQYFEGGWLRGVEDYLKLRNKK